MFSASGDNSNKTSKEMSKDHFSFESYVKMTLDSGIAPIELRFRPIVSAEAGYTVAFRSEIIIHSVVLGFLTEKDYTVASDKSELSTELIKHGIRYLKKAMPAFEKKGKEISFFTLRCPKTALFSPELPAFIADFTEKNQDFVPERLCLEFPKDVIFEDAAKVKKAILDLKILKVKTAIDGCGEEDFPLMRLADIYPDIAFIHPSATKWATDRNKPQLFPSLVSCIKGMGITAVAEGEKEWRSQLRGCECFGFIDTCADNLTFDDALNQKEEW